MNLRIDTLAYTNNLRDVHPWQKFLFAIALFVITFISRPDVQIAIVIWLAIWIIYHAKIPANLYLKIITTASIFLIISLPALIINIISISSPDLLADSLGGIIINKWYIYLSYTGWQQALAIFCRSLASISCLFFLLLTIPFAEILQILRQLGLPAILTDLLLLMYRFIFILLATANQLWLAREARNGHSSWQLAMGSLGMLIVQLLHNTFQRYRQFSLSLDSRGFNGEFRFLQNRKYKYHFGYAVEAIAGCILLLQLEFFA